MRWVVVACLMLAGCAEAGFPLPGQARKRPAYGGPVAVMPSDYLPPQAFQQPMPQMAPAQLGPRSVTNCQRYGNAVNCSTY